MGGDDSLTYRQGPMQRTQVAHAENRENRSMPVPISKSAPIDY
jgi:hypothetical protein